MTTVLCMSVDHSPFRGGHTAGSPPRSQACRIGGIDLTTVEIKPLFCAAYKRLCVSPSTTHASWTFPMLVLVQTALTGLDARWPWVFVIRSNHQSIWQGWHHLQRILNFTDPNIKLDLKLGAHDGRYFTCHGPLCSDGALLTRSQQGHGSQIIRSLKFPFKM